MQCCAGGCEHCGRGIAAVQVAVRTVTEAPEVHHQHCCKAASQYGSSSSLTAAAPVKCLSIAQHGCLSKVQEE